MTPVHQNQGSLNARLHIPATIAAVVVCVLGAAQAASAQRASSSIDIGATQMRYADSIAATAIAASPSLRLAWPHATIRGWGSYAQLRGGGGWTMQGSADLTALTPNVGPVSGEIEVATGGSAHWDGTRTGQSFAMARALVGGARGGMWAGAGAGLTWSGYEWQGLTLGDFGIWTQSGRGTLAATLSPTAIGDTIHYVDTEIAARWTIDRLELNASAGTRAGDRLVVLQSSGRVWGGIGVTAWLTPRMGIVAGAGSYPVDLTQGFPGGRYAMLGFRIAAARSLLSPEDEAVRRYLEPAPPVAPELEVRAAADGGRTIHLLAPSARSVDIAGDFSAWEPIPLVRAAGGSWNVALPLRPGTYEVAIRLNAGPWLVPSGLVPLTDEFGGAVGLLVIR